MRMKRWTFFTVLKGEICMDVGFMAKFLMQYTY